MATGHKCITIVPLYSGYRDDRGHLTLINDYETLIEVSKQIFGEKRNIAPDQALVLRDTEEEKIIVSLTRERCNYIVENTLITFPYEEIALISEWLPELYSIQSLESEPLNNVRHT